MRRLPRRSFRKAIKCQQCCPRTITPDKEGAACAATGKADTAEVTPIFMIEIEAVAVVNSERRSPAAGLRMDSRVR
jgi:hypothetical protein